MKGFIRPGAKVLPDSAVVGKSDVVTPAPNQFTHELTRAAPYFYASKGTEGAPDGELPAATAVVLLTYSGGEYAHVVDGQGLHLVVPYDSLRKLQP
jgi:hypothetical protein